MFAAASIFQASQAKGGHALCPGGEHPQVAAGQKIPGVKGFRELWSLALKLQLVDVQTL